MQKLLIKILLISALFTMLGVLAANAETTLDAAEQYLQRLQFYEDMNDRSAPVSSTDAGEESVNRINGGITFKKTDLSLRGKGGMELDLTRKINSKSNINMSGKTQSLSISGVTSQYQLNNTYKYLFRYYTESGSTVYIAYDSPQQMLEAENGENKITVASNYTSHYQYASNQENDYGITTLMYGVSGFIDFSLGDRYYLYRELPAGDAVTLNRDLNCGYATLTISSIHVSSYELNSSIMKEEVIGGGWIWELPTIQYRQTMPKLITLSGAEELNIYNGMLFDDNDVSYKCWNGKVEHEDPNDSSIIYPDSGTFYTAKTGDAGRIALTAYVEDGAYWLANETLGLKYVLIPNNDTMCWRFDEEGSFYNPEDGICLDFKYSCSMDIGNYIDNHFDFMEMFSYEPVGTTYGEKYSDMYTLSMEQEKYNTPLYMTFTRYDGTSYRFEVKNSSAYYWVSGNPDTAISSGDYIGKQDRYGNKITYSRSGKNLVVNDTLNRTIKAGPTGITVNGVQVVDYTLKNRVNDNTVDPNNMISQDETYSLKVKYVDTGKVIEYLTKEYMDTYVLGTHGTIELTVGLNNVAIDSVVLPTGAQSIYEYRYQRGKHRNNKKVYLDKDMIMLTKRYELAEEGSNKENELSFSYDLSSFDARTATIIKADSPGYSITETYDEHGYLSNATETNSDSGNTYYKSSDYQYAYQNEGNFLPIKEITTVKTSKSASGAQTVVIEKEYNNRQQLTAQKRDGEYILKNTYDSNYGLLTGMFSKKDSAKWTGTVNTLTSDKKAVAAAYAAEKAGMDAAAQMHEATLYTYTASGDISSITEKGTTTNYTYSYTAYPNNTTVPKANSLIKTATIASVGSIADNNATGSNTQNLVTTETYDWLGRMISSKDGKQNVTSYEYDNAGRITKQTNPDATTVMVEYDDTNNTIITTAEGGVKQKLVYDPLGRNAGGYVYSAETEAWLKMYENSYDGQSRLTVKKVYNDDGTEKSRITYTYFGDGQPGSETVLEGNTVLSKKEYAYAPYNGTNESAVSARVYSSDSGFLTATQYTDKYGYRTKDTVAYDAVINTQSYTTDLLGNLLTVKDFKANADGASSPTVTYTYDYANRQTQVTTIAGTVTSSYDTYGRLASETDARGNSAYYTYNAAGWVTQVRTPIDDTGEAITNTYYDANGNAARTEVKQEGTKYNVTKNFYDSRNRLTAALNEDAAGSVITKYEYDDAGHITKQAVGLASVNDTINPETHKVTSYSYDSLGRMVSSTDPLGQQSTFQYSILGELLSETDRNGVVKTYDYDGLGRLKELSANGGTEVVSYVYDLMGNMTQMVDSAGTTAYTYSKKGELLSETRSGVTKNYGYDANGNRTSFTVPAMGISATYGYDAIGRMTSFTDSGTTTSYTYDGNGNLLSETTDGGRTVTYSYNKANLLTGKTNKMGANTLETYALTYYADGNVKSVTENGEAKSYTYDGIGRLTKETTADAVTQYAYDKYNNRTGKQVYDSQNVLQSETAYTYDKNNRLTEIVEEAGDATYYTELSYDKNGNRIMEMLSGTTTASGDETPSFGISGSSPYVATYGYDVLGRMTGMAQGDTTASYTYDGAGLRQSKTVDGMTTSFVLDGMYVAAETSGETSTYYSRGVNLISRSTGGSKDYYYMNSHGDVTKLVNSSGTVVVDYTYDAFGNQTSETEDSNPFRYAGEYWDSESGLIYLRARYYDSGVGGFTSADTHWNVGNMIYGDDNAGIPSIAAILQSGNLYVYCMGNPVNCIDPFGTVAYEHFNTKEEALKDWAWNYYGISDYVLVELGSVLFWSRDENNNLYYSYTWANVGDFHEVDTFVPMAWVPKGATAVATIHSHPNSENFSFADTNLAKDRNLDSYIVTPSRNILRYGLNRQDTKWNKSVVVSNVPIAPLSWERKRELRNKFENKWRQHQLNGCEFNCQYKLWPRG